MHAKTHNSTIRIAALLCAALTPCANAQHVHGVIDLGIVVDGSSVGVTLSSPLANAVGFEHAPRTTEETEQVMLASKKLLNAQDMFVLSGDANCTTQRVTIDGPTYLTEPKAAEADDGHGDEGHDDHNDEEHDKHGDDEHDDEEHNGHGDNQDDHDNEEHDGHGDDHDDHDDEEHDGHGDDHDEHDDEEHDGHGDDHEDHEGHHDDDDHEQDKHSSESHSEVAAQYLWECNSPSNLKQIHLRFVSWFADVDKVNVQLITPDGVQLLEADGKTDSIELDQ